MENVEIYKRLLSETMWSNNNSGRNRCELTISIEGSLINIGSSTYRTPLTDGDPINKELVILSETNLSDKLLSG